MSITYSYEIEFVRNELFWMNIFTISDMENSICSVGRRGSPRSRGKARPRQPRIRGSNPAASLIFNNKKNLISIFSEDQPIDILEKAA